MHIISHQNFFQIAAAMLLKKKNLKKPHGFQLFA